MEGVLVPSAIAFSVDQKEALCEHVVPMRVGIGVVW